MKTILIVTIKETGELLAFTTVPKFTKSKIISMNPQSILNAMSTNNGIFENDTLKVQRLQVNK